MLEAIRAHVAQHVQLVAEIDDQDIETGDVGRRGAVVRRHIVGVGPAQIAGEAGAPSVLAGVMIDHHVGRTMGGRSYFVLLLAARVALDLVGEGEAERGELERGAAGALQLGRAGIAVGALGASA